MGTRTNPPEFVLHLNIFPVFQFISNFPTCQYDPFCGGSASQAGHRPRRRQEGVLVDLFLAGVLRRGGHLGHLRRLWRLSPPAARGCSACAEITDENSISNQLFFTAPYHTYGTHGLILIHISTKIRYRNCVPVRYPECELGSPLTYRT